MRLEILNDTLTTSTLPWDAAVSDWQTGRAGSGEIARFIDSPSALAVCEVPHATGQARMALLKTMQSYGLPVVEPVALAQDRDHGGDLLVMAWHQNAITLREALSNAQSFELSDLQNAVAKLLVHTHLAGMNLTSNWSLVFQKEDTEINAYIFGVDGDMQLALTTREREASLKSLQDYLKHVASQVDYSIGEAVALATAVARLYNELWNQIEGIRLFDQDDMIHLTARVMDLDALNDRQRHLVTKADDNFAMSVRYRFVNDNHHKMLLHMLTGINTNNEAGRHVLRDIAKYHAWLEFSSERPWPRALAANRWVNEVYAPAMRALPPLPQLPTSA